MATFRRSKREANAVKLSNGRDYLAGKLLMSRKQLENFLTSSKVLPHLVLWSKLCIDGPRRYNDACEWINFLEGKYYEDGGELEEDLLLACLGEGYIDLDHEDAAVEVSIFADHNASTASWCTQDLWARTAWRIVQDNCAPGDVFQNTFKNLTSAAIPFHPAAAYAVVIDILCLAFSSIASRPPEFSCWYALINDSPTQEKTRAALAEVAAYAANQAIDLDHKSDTEASEDSEMEDVDSDEDELATVETASESVESEFQDPESPCTKDTSVSEASQVTPTRSHKKKVVEPFLGDELVQNWMDSLLSIGKEARVDAALSMIDEDGRPITGYRSVTRNNIAQNPAVESDPSMEVLGSDDDIVLAGSKVRIIYDSDDDEVVVPSKTSSTVYDFDNGSIAAAGVGSSSASESDDDEIAVANMRIETVDDSDEDNIVVAQTRRGNTYA